jgi:hypothetical protein
MFLLPMKNIFLYKLQKKLQRIINLLPLLIQHNIVMFC